MIVRGTPFTRVLICTTGWTPCGGKHVRYHAMQGILATHGQLCIHNGRRSLWMHFQLSIYDGNATFQTLASQQPIWAHCHANSWSVAEDKKWQPAHDNHDRRIIEAQTNSPNVKIKRSAYGDHLLPRVNRILWDTCIFTEIQWHTSGEGDFQNHMQLLWIEVSYDHYIQSPDEMEGTTIQ